MAVKGVLFDFWGTLIENGINPSPVKQAKSIIRVKMPFVSYIQTFEKALMTQEFTDLREAFQNVINAFEARVPDFVVDKLVGMWNKNTLLAKPFPEALDTLKSLRDEGYKIGLISNTDPFSVNQVLDKYELRGYFDSLVLSYEVGMLKADPQMFDTACEQLGLSKDEVVMVGDSIESDMRAAENAGVTPILVDRRESREFDRRITDLKQVFDHMG